VITFFVAGGVVPRALTKEGNMPEKQYSEAVIKWAESLGFTLDDPRVKKYADETGGHMTDERGRPIDEDSRKFEDAVRRYAESQGLDTEHPRVQKYARGLRSKTGDFGGREQDSTIGARK